MDAPFHVDVFHFISVHVDGFYTPFSYLKKGMGDPHFGERQRENLQNNVYMFFILQMQLVILLYMDSLTMLSEENL